MFPVVSQYWALTGRKKGLERRLWNSHWAKQAPEEAMFKHWKTMSVLRQNTGEIPQMFLSRNSLNTNGRLSLLSSSILAKIFNFWVFNLSGLLVSGV